MELELEFREWGGEIHFCHFISFYLFFFYFNKTKLLLRGQNILIMHLLSDLVATIYLFIFHLLIKDLLNCIQGPRDTKVEDTAYTLKKEMNGCDKKWE